MKKKRKTYRHAIKLVAVRLAKGAELSLARIAEELGTHVNSFRACPKPVEADPAHAFAGKHRLKSKTQELRLLHLVSMRPIQVLEFSYQAVAQASPKTIEGMIRDSSTSGTLRGEYMDPQMRGLGHPPILILAAHRGQGEGSEH